MAPMGDKDVQAASAAAASWLEARADDARPKRSATSVVNRVNQVDAVELDAELDRYIHGQLTTTLSPIAPSVVQRFTPEIDAIVRGIVFAFTIGAGVPSPGNQLQNLEYAPMSRTARVCHGLLTVIFPWVFARAQHHAPARIADRVHILLRVAIIVNRIAFLYGSVYRSVTDRIVGAQLRYRRPRVQRQLTFDFMNQELVWTGASEFLLFIVPLLNTSALRSLMRKAFGKSTTVKSGDDGSCGVCGAHPITVPVMSSCNHLFCYYCLRASRMAPDFKCPVCDSEITSQSMVTDRNRTVLGVAG